MLPYRAVQRRAWLFGMEADLEGSVRIKPRDLIKVGHQILFLIGRIEPGSFAVELLA